MKLPNSIRILAQLVWTSSPAYSHQSGSIKQQKRQNDSLDDEIDDENDREGQKGPPPPPPKPPGPPQPSIQPPSTTFLVAPPPQPITTLTAWPTSNATPVVSTTLTQQLTSANTSPSSHGIVVTVEATMAPTSSPDIPSFPTGISSNAVASQGSSSGIDRNLVVILSIVFSVVGATTLIIGILIFWKCRNRRFRFRRGISPIDDEEIESWKTNRFEKASVYQQDDADVAAVEKQPSTRQIKKPPSVIIYQNPRVSADLDTARSSPPATACSPFSKRSLDFVQSPQLARAPNSRPGLTDDCVKGDDAFISPLPRHPSRLSKQQNSPRHMRSRSSRSNNSIGSLHDHWHGYIHGTGSVTAITRDAATFDVPAVSPRRSVDNFSRPSVSVLSDPRLQRKYSAPSNTLTSPILSLGDDFEPAGLSPRPVEQSYIGRAIG